MEFAQELANGVGQARGGHPVLDFVELIAELFLALVAFGGLSFYGLDRVTDFTPQYRELQILLGEVPQRRRHLLDLLFGLLHGGIREAAALLIDVAAQPRNR